jgi:predicted dehydrogenase
MHLAIIGTGNVVKNNYLPFLSQQKDVTLAYWNRDRAKAEACAQQFGGAVHATVADLMASKPDVVFVLTSEKARYELALEALKAKPKRIFFEKPLCARNGQSDVTEDDFVRGREVMQAAAAVGAETAMIFNYRFFDHIAAARRLIADRQLGPAVAATGWVHHACWSHCLDLVAMFLGSPAKIAALNPANDGPRPVAVSLTTANGACATILRTGGWDLFHPAYELTIGFTHGRITVRGIDGEVELVDYRTHATERVQPGRNDSQWKAYDRSFARSLDAYLGAVRRDEAPPVPGRAGLEELRCEAAIARSARTGATIDLDQAFPLTLPAAATAKA